MTNDKLPFNIYNVHRRTCLECRNLILIFLPLDFPKIIICSYILLRYLHSTPELWARRNNNEPVSEQNSKKKPSNRGKFAKRVRTEPPVEAPYVPPRLKRTTKSLPDKTIDIFEGMTIIELAKRTGESTSTLQDILVNVGEKVESEFDPLSIDIAELVTMVFPLLSCKYYIVISHIMYNTILENINEIFFNFYFIYLFFLL